MHYGWCFFLKGVDSIAVAQDPKSGVFQMIETGLDDTFRTENIWRRSSASAAIGGVMETSNFCLKDA